MADDNYLTGTATAPTGDQPVGTAGDFGKTLGAGALGIGSNLAAGARYFFEQGQSPNAADIAQGLQKIFGAGSEAISDTINPETKKLAASTLTSEEFWQHPVLAAALKTTGMVPAVAALAIPGGLMADAVAATMAVAAGGAAVNAGAGLDEFYKKLDSMSDAELQAQAPKYKAMREMFDEKTARARFNREAQGWGPAINAVLGAAATAVGPAGTAARGLAGGAGNAVAGASERGALASAGIGAAEGALGNAVQSGASDVTSQQADIEGGMQREFDKARTANAALEGGALGGFMGGAVGLVAGGGAHGQAPAPKVDKVAKALDTTSDVGTPQPQTGRATTAPAKPPENVPVGNPQNAPTRSDRDGSKPNANTKTKSQEKATTAPPAALTPDPGITAAIASNDEGQQKIVSATEVAALTQGSPNETIAKLNAGEQQPPAPVTPQGNAAPLDTGQNIPEQPQGIAEQIKQIGTGNRKAVMLPKGTVVPAEMLAGRTDLRSMNTPRGRFIFDPKLTNRGEITKLSNLGRENELLGLGPVSKPEAVARVAAGETPAAVVERTPTGTEVKAAAGTDQTAPTQVASLEANKTPGNVVGVEAPEQTIIKRMQTGEPPKRAPRILPNLAQTAETVPLSDFNANKVPEPKEVKGKRYSEEERAVVDEKLAKAKAITDANVPDAREDNYMRDKEARNAIISRAQAMVDAADKEGVKIQGQLKKSTKGDAPSDHPSMQILRAAKDLTRTLAKKKKIQERAEAAGKFAEAERLIRGGYSDEVLAQRREEGDVAMKRGPKGEEVSAATEVTPESELARKEGAEVVSKDEAASVTPEGKQDVEKNQVKTAVAGSAKGEVRGVSAPTEERVVRNKAGVEEKVETAKAANKGRVFTAEERAAAAAKYATGPIKNNARRVNLNPTEGQKRAGNYKKGHRRVEGLDYTIENPRGAVRRGVDEHGEPWSVRMPADYGYIRGTEGADGDHVDAYDLRSGKRHFVVDQLDHKTGEFDEHKIMLRARDEAHAVETYHNSFADGRGPERLGYLHEVGAPELKDWLAKGDTTQPHAQHALGEGDFAEDSPFRRLEQMLAAEQGRKRDTARVNVWDGKQWVSIKPWRTSTLGDELSKLDLKGMPGVNGVLARFFKKELGRLAENVKVHFVDSDQMDRAAGDEASEGLSTVGLHAIGQDNRGNIFINIEHADTSHTGEGSLAHTLMHEGAHAITVREITKNREIREHIGNLAYIADKYITENQARIELEYRGSDIKYGFTDPNEFVAEAFSNAGFQKLLSEIPVDKETLHALKLDVNRPQSLWDTFRSFVKQIIFGAENKSNRFESVLDGIMRVGEHIAYEHERTHARQYKTGATTASPHDFANVQARRLTDNATQVVKDWLRRPENNTPERAPKVLKMRTFDNLAQIADHYFGESNPVRKIHEAIERMRVTGQKIFERSEPLIKRLVTLRAANGEQFKEFSSLLHDATVANVHPDVPLSDARNAHLGKARVVGDAVWSKSQHPELAKRYRALIKENPAYEGMWRDVVKHYADTQNKMTLGIINNQILKLMGIKDAALGDRIHQDTLTDADKAALGNNLDVIEKASELSKIEGPYVPLMRRGDHVVKADRKVTQPGNSKKIGDNEFEFNTEKEATDYAKASDLRTTIKKVWVDEKTGELHQIDPTTGKEHRMVKEDLDSVDRYRVEVQNRHVEFVQGRRAAEARAAELAKDGELSVHKVVPRAYEPGGRQAQELSTSLGNLVKKLQNSDAYKQASPTQQATMRAAINEAALASHGSTRVSSRALPRRGVKGYSEDLVQNTVDYGASSSRYLARLEHGNELEAGLEQMKNTLDRDHSKTGQYARTALSNEVLSRVNGDNGFQQGGKLSPIIKRALSVSFIDKLGSPAYSVINAMQPGMVTMPYLIGRHGIGRSFAAMGKAYADISALKIVKEGFKETGRRIAGRRAPEDFLTSITKNLSPDERRMIDEHVKVGTIDPSAGLEIGELARDRSGIGGKLDTGLSYLEGVTREMPRAIEAINRAVTAIAAYRLERAKGADHEAAVQYSKDAVNSTQFNYSPTNAPPLFNHPLLKIALQFKKYGQGMYQLMGSQIANAIRNEKPGDRAQAVKTLITLAATHTAVAGALGLPTEPFKYLVLAAHGLGMVPYTWGDVEDKIRHQAANMFGKTAGEVLTKGLPHLLNVDLSRAGLDTITSFGEPKSNKESEVKTWLFDSVAGPVVSLGGDWIKGLNQITNGDFEKAAENLIPLKAASDSLRAYRQATEGKKSASGKQTMKPYTPTESALRVLGFGSAREEEIGAANSAFYRNSARQKEERTGLVNAWVQADPKSKTKAWAAIQKWNTQQPADVKIVPKELTDKAARDAKAASSAVRGISANKRDKRFLDEGAIYNTGT